MHKTILFVQCEVIFFAFYLCNCQKVSYFATAFVTHIVHTIDKQ